MNKFFLICCIFSVLFACSAVLVQADIIILKNGQVLNDVTIKEEGDSLYCENKDQSFYINKNTVENVVRTGPCTFPEKIKDFFVSLPLKIRLFVKDYFAFAATITCILILLAGLIIFKAIWINLSPVFKNNVRRGDVIKAVKQLDADEKSVLREFYIQQANTLEMPVEDIVVSGLIKKGILQTTLAKGPYSVGGLMLPVIISPLAKKHIKPGKIDMPSNLNDPEVRETLSKSRPQYMYEMAGFYQSLEKSDSNRL
jgi:hypothetical protein